MAAALARPSATRRSVPLAIIHGKNDPVLDFSLGEYAAVVFGEAGWPAFRFFADASPAGHRWLPWAYAELWVMSIGSRIASAW